VLASVRLMRRSFKSRHEGIADTRHPKTPSAPVRLAKTTTLRYGASSTARGAPYQPTLLQRLAESGVCQRARPTVRRGPRQSGSGAERYSRRPASTISDAAGATGPPRPPVLPLSSRRDRHGGPGNLRSGYGKALVTGQHRTVSIYAADSPQWQGLQAPRGQDRGWGPE
jgi:hypothetical protein